jgi:hypothetical protein
MFNSRRMEELDLEVRTLRTEVEKLKSDLEKAKNYSFPTGNAVLMDWGVWSPPSRVPEYKTISIKTLLEKLLEVAGLKIVYTSGSPETIEVKASATQPRNAKTARPNKQKKV